VTIRIGTPAELADPDDDLPAIETGQGDVEDHEIGMLVIELPKGVVAGRREDRPITGLGHPQLEQRRELGLVLDDEDAFSH